MGKCHVFIGYEINWIVFLCTGKWGGGINTTYYRKQT